MTSLALIALWVGTVDPSLVPGAPRLLVGHTGTIVTVAFSPDGKKVASGGFEAAVRVFDVASGKQLLELTGPKENVTTVAFSPDGKLLAAGDAGFAITLWSLADGKVVRVLHNAEPLGHVIFSPDGKLLAGGGITGTGEVYAVANGKELFEIRIGTPTFSKDSKTIGGTSRAGGLLLYDAASGKLKKELKGTAPTSTVALSDLSRFYGYSGDEPKIAVLDGTTGKPGEPLVGAAVGISSLALSSDDALLVAASADKVVLVYGLAKGTVLRKFPLEKVGFVAISPDKKTIAVGDGVIVKLFAL